MADQHETWGSLGLGLGVRVRVRRRVAEGDEPVRDRDKGGLVNSNHTFLSLLYSSSGPFLSIARVRVRGSEPCRRQGERQGLVNILRVGESS